MTAGRSAPPTVSPGVSRRLSPALLAFGIAHAGGVIAYMPLLSLMLPGKVEAVAGHASLGIFTAAVIGGGIAASLSNILFGWLSDRDSARGRGRRRLALVGLTSLAPAYAFITLANSAVALILGVILFQAAINLVLAPLFAMMADEVPDAQKGTLGGLISLGEPLAGLVAALILGTAMFGFGSRLLLVFALVCAAFAPLLSRRPTPLPLSAPPPAQEAMLRRDLVIAWTSRILIQVSAAVLSLYLVYMFEAIASAPAAQVAPRVSALLTVAFLVAVPVTVGLGRISDRRARRKPFLLAAALVAALGLVGMTLARDWVAGAAAYCVYAVGSSAFRSLHAAFAMQLLPDPRHRGRDLGLLNLTNTLPILAGPLLTWLLATPGDFGAALLALAALTALGGVTVLGVRGWR
ncbi:MFS transporter [Sphingomonas sp. RS6]